MNATIYGRLRQLVLTSTAMLKNYFKTAWRNLFKNKFYSFINILGLTTGLAVGILILLWVQDELSFDTFHSKAAHIYQVNTPMGTRKTVWNTTQGPVATYALKEVPGVKNAVRIKHKYSSLLAYKDKSFQEENNALQTLLFSGCSTFN